MVFFVLAYVIFGAALCVAFAWHESKRKGPQDMNFVISLGMEYPPLLILIVGLWPLALLCVFLCYFLSKNDEA
jgi:hypothetical protein